MTQERKEEVFRERLRQFRLESDKSTYTIFKNTNIPPFVIKDIENGNRPKGCLVQTVFKLLNEYNRTAEELFKGL